MKKNLGRNDRIIRFVFALIFFGFVITGLFTGAAAWAMLIVGTILLFTSLLGVCPLYTFLGVHTNSHSRQTH